MNGEDFDVGSLDITTVTVPMFGRKLHQTVLSAGSVGGKEKLYKTCG